MIKLTRKENELLEELWVKSRAGKIKAIKEIYSGKLQVLSNNTLLKLTQAILDGKWEVEEPLYYVRNNKGVALLRKLKGEIVASQPFDRFFTDNNEDFQLTEHEVASYDQRYLEFLEEVE